MDVKRFSTPDPNVGDPLPFELEVVRIIPADDESEERRERETLTFGARPDVSGGVLLQVESMSAQQRRHARSADALTDFFEAALIPEDRHVVIDDTEWDLLGWPDFRKLVDDPQTYMHIDTLIDISTWLYGHYARRRPTKPRR